MAQILPSDTEVATAFTGLPRETSYVDQITNLALLGIFATSIYC